MSSTYTCLTCRRYIKRCRNATGWQWHTRATFLSLANNARTTTDQSLEENLLELGNGGSDDHSASSLSPLLSTTRPPGLSRNRHSRQLEKLFEQTLQQRLQGADSTSDFKDLSVPTRAVSFDNARRFTQLLEENDLPAAWAFFEETFGPGSLKIGRPDKSLKHLIRSRNMAWRLMRKITEAKSQDVLSEQLPSATRVTSAFWRVGILYGVDWTNMMLVLLRNIPSIDDKILEDILGMWNIVCRHRSPSDVNVQALTFPMDWSKLPELSMQSVYRHRSKHQLHFAFGLIVPAIPSKELHDLPAISVAVFGLLKRLEKRGHIAGRDAFPLMSSLAQIITACDADFSELTAGLSHKAGPTFDYIKSRWHSIKEQASQVVESCTKSSGLSTSYLKAPQQSLQFRSTSIYLHKRLQDAFSCKSVNLVDAIWNTASQLPIHRGPTLRITTSASADVPEDPDIRGKLSIPLCNYFILVYMALGKPDGAVKVWNHMVNNCISPTMVTWHSMMMGCRKARDSEALEGIWSRMVNIGMKPDAICWTTRIRALIDMNKTDLALQALNDMGKQWLQQVHQRFGVCKKEFLLNTGDMNGIPKPTIETINAAVSGVLQNKRPDLAQQIFHWAGKFGLSADISTYNTLLRCLVREDASSQVTIVLEQMQNQGIDADTFTFCIILEETFRKAEDISPEENVNLVDHIFRQMEPLGIKPTLHIYGKIVSQLLRSGDGPNKASIKAVRAVIDRMFTQGISSGTYIHTMLAEYYFAQDPPDIAGVDSLIERAKLLIGSVDHVFWDRIIEGFSKVGDTSGALRILELQRSGGCSKVSWFTLRTLLTALVNKEDWNGARILVSTTRLEGGGPILDEKRGKAGQHAFWKFVEELKLWDNIAL